MADGINDREGRLEVAGGSVWYRVVGERQATPLVIVHGGPGGTHDYLEPLEALADERPVVFYDQLGAGKSDAPDDIGLWTNDRMVDELGRIVNALALGRVHLLGQSWGSIIVAEYALRTPGRVAGLILANPCLSLPRYAAGTAALRAALPAGVREALDRHEAAGTTDSDEYQEAEMEFFRRHACRLDPWPEALMRTFSQVNQTIYERMQGPSEFRITGIHKDYDVTDRLGELTVPTLFLVGRYDMARPEDTAWYHSLVPGSELVIFEKSSHMPHLEEPSLFFPVLRDFLQRAEQEPTETPQGSNKAES